MTIDLVIEPRRRDLGGFEVARLLPAASRRMVGPFVFLDRMGPAQFPPGLPRSADVRPHPHIGLSTLTYLFAGEIMHRDSVGSVQPIRPGEVNWMTAGRGITHSERFERARREGGPMDGLQAWVALPREDEETDPAFTHHAVASLPESVEAGVRRRLIAGEAWGQRSPVRVHSPLFYADCALVAGGRVRVPEDYAERAAYVVDGEVEADGTRCPPGQLVVFGGRAPAVIAALTPARVVLLGGEPVGERYLDWNFVSSSRERIEQAKADWRAGRMKLPEHDDQERIPLPD
jgi:redox-sensitive bicupin YhaK (pirin superfamily)